MKTGIAIVVTVTILSALFGAITWTPEIGGFDVVTTTVMSAFLGAGVGVFIATVTWILNEVLA